MLYRAPGRFGPGKSANLFGFDHRKPTNTRLGPAKVPQPGVDLIHMAAPARSLASAVSTPEFEGLLLSRSVLVWNGRRGKKARKERHPPKKVLCPTDIESRDRRGFIQLPNSVRFHGPSGMKAKILKRTEENQAMADCGIRD